MKNSLIHVLGALTLVGSSHFTQAELYAGSAVGYTDYANVAEDVTSLEIMAGLRLGNSLALEASWLDLGEENIDFGGGRAEYAIEGWQFAVMPIIPLGPELDLFFKTGVYFWEVESSAITTSTLFRSKNSEDDVDLTYGGGFTWHLSNNMGLRVQYQEVDIRGENLDNLSVGFTFSF